MKHEPLDSHKSTTLKKSAASSTVDDNSNGDSKSSSSSSSNNNLRTEQLHILKLPMELQVNLLTYLRAFDLSSVQQTCRFYNNPVLVHAIVAHTAEHVYPAVLTSGFEQQPTSRMAAATTAPAGATTKLRTIQEGSDEEDEECEGRRAALLHEDRYTFEHLRNMELLVVARVLSRPEPAVGYIVSKSWCKQALRWLEVQQQEQAQKYVQQKQKKKLSKKKERLRQRRLSDASPPWPNVNSDLLCEHNSLSRCSNSKQARARRRIMDKLSWKILNRLYPDSCELDSAAGECLQCFAEAETARKSEQDRLEMLKLERMLPLNEIHIRRFYARTRGFPEHRLVAQNNNESAAVAAAAARIPGHGTGLACPLETGTYYLLPRAWCYAWRRYMRTGEGLCPGPPDGTRLLCDAHRMALVPPHLEAFLAGKTAQLLTGGVTSATTNMAPPPPPSSVHLSPPPFIGSPTISTRDIMNPAAIPGLAPVVDIDSVQALLAAGLSSEEVSRQVSAMRRREQQLELQQQQQQQQQRQLQQQQMMMLMNPPTSTVSKNDLLDRENHSVVEIVTMDEYTAMEEHLWSGCTIFSLSFVVEAQDRHITYSTAYCRDCDASGRQYTSALSIKNRDQVNARKKATDNRRTKIRMAKSMTNSNHIHLEY